MKYKIFFGLMLACFIMIMSVSGCGQAITQSKPKILVSDLLSMKHGEFKKYNLTPGSSILEIKKKLKNLKISIKENPEIEGHFIVGKDQTINLMISNKSIKSKAEHLIVTQINIVPKANHWTESEIERTLSQPLGSKLKNKKKNVYYSKFLTIIYAKHKKEWQVEKIEYHQPKRIIIYARLDYSIDTHNLRQVVEDADYVFVGNIMNKNKTRYENEMTNADGSKFAEAYSSYDIKVLANIKGNLPLMNKVEIEKQGGIRKDQSAYDIPEGDIIPGKNKSYIFIAYRQPDGTLLVSGANSTIALEKKYDSSSLKQLLRSEVYKRYQIK